LPDGGYFETIKYSHYNPQLGGVNCYIWSYELNTCISNMHSGKPWQSYMELAVACPPEWAEETKVYLDNKEWICLDWGGDIIYDKFGYTFVDFLTSSPQYKYEEYVDVYVIPP
jgi:hypothetical protein